MLNKKKEDSSHKPSTSQQQLPSTVMSQQQSNKHTRQISKSTVSEGPNKIAESYPIESKKDLSEEEEEEDAKSEESITETENSFQP